MLSDPQVSVVRLCRSTKHSCTAVCLTDRLHSAVTGAPHKVNMAAVPHASAVRGNNSLQVYRMHTGDASRMQAAARMNHSRSLTAAHIGHPKAGDPTSQPAPSLSGSPPATLAMWRLHSSDTTVSPMRSATDGVVSPQSGSSLSQRQHNGLGNGALQARRLSTDLESLSPQRPASVAASSDSVAAGEMAAAALHSRFILQSSAIPEHSAPPLSALPASLLHAHAAAAPCSQEAAAAGPRDICPAASTAVHMVEGVPLRPVAGSAEWPAGRVGAPRLTLEIPTGAEGRYSDVHLMQTPGAGLGSSQTATSEPGFSGASSAVRCIDIAVRRPG